MNKRRMAAMFLALFACSWTVAISVARREPVQASERPTSPEIEKLRLELIALQSDLFIVGEQLKRYQQADRSLRQEHAEKTRQLTVLEAAWRQNKALEKITTETLSGG